MNVSGAEAQYEIARIQHVTDIAMHPVQTRLITHAAMTVVQNFIRNRLAADSGNWRFASGINIRHNHAIGVIERTSKFFPERFCAGIAMRLKHSQYTFATGRSCSF